MIFWGNGWRTVAMGVALFCTTGCGSSDLVGEANERENVGEIQEAVAVPKTIAANWTGKDAMVVYKGGTLGSGSSIDARWKRPNQPDGPWTNWTPFLTEYIEVFDIAGERFSNKAQLIAVHLSQNAILLNAQLDPDGAWTGLGESMPLPANVGQINSIALVGDGGNKIILAIAAPSGVWAKVRDERPPSNSTTRWSSWVLVSSGAATELTAIQRRDGKPVLLWLRNNKLQAATRSNTQTLSFNVDTAFGGTQNLTRLAAGRTERFESFVYCVTDDGTSIMTHSVEAASSEYGIGTGGGLGANERITSLAATNGSNGRKVLFAVTSAGRVLHRWYVSGRNWEPWVAF